MKTRFRYFVLTVNLLLNIIAIISINSLIMYLNDSFLTSKLDYFRISFSFIVLLDLLLIMIFNIKKYIGIFYWLTCLMNWTSIFLLDKFYRDVLIFYDIDENIFLSFFQLYFHVSIMYFVEFVIDIDKFYDDNHKIELTNK